MNDEKAYPAGITNRCRATHAKMDDRSAFLISYAKERCPVIVRQLFDAAVVAGASGIHKNEDGYAQIQAQVLNLRRAGHWPYGQIADASRFMRNPQSFEDLEEALLDAARLYRMNPWADTDIEVEIWCDYDVVVNFESTALSADQVYRLDLTVQPAKRRSAADRRWRYSVAAELDAIPPDRLFDMERNAIDYHLPADELDRLKLIEEAGRQTLCSSFGALA